MVVLSFYFPLESKWQLFPGTVVVVVVMTIFKAMEIIIPLIRSQLQVKKKKKKSHLLISLVTLIAAEAGRRTPAQRSKSQVMKLQSPEI